MLIFLCLATAPTLLVILLFLLSNGLESQQHWQHTTLEREMAEAGISPPTPDETNWVTPRPPIASVSPCGYWTVNALWRQGNGGYDWELQNNRTGQTFHQGNLPNTDLDSLPTHLWILWSPDSRYVAITAVDANEFERLYVICLIDSEPQYVTSGTGVDPLGSVYAHPRGGSLYARTLVTTEVRSKASRWLSDTDLQSVLYVKQHESQNPVEIQYAIQQTYHLTGSSVEMKASKLLFRETYLTDL